MMSQIPVLLMMMMMMMMILVVATYVSCSGVGGTTLSNSQAVAVELIKDNDAKHLTNPQSLRWQRAQRRKARIDSSSDESGGLFFDDSDSASSENVQDYDSGEEEEEEDEEDGSGDSSREPVPRLLSQSALNRITETLGALNTVGHILVDMTRGGSFDTKNDKSGNNAANEVALSTSSSADIGQIDIINSTKLPELYSNRTYSDVLTSSKIGLLPADSDTRKKKKVKKNKNKNKQKKQTTEAGLQSTVNNRTEPGLNGNIPPTTKNPATGQDFENRCKTPSGRPGRCEDLSSCPALLLNLSSLRESLCFKKMFVPGVCCPIPAKPIVTLTTQRPLRLTTKPPVQHGSNSSQILKPITAGTRPPITNLVLVSQSNPSPAVAAATVTTVIDKIDKIDNNIVSAADCGQQEYSSGRIVGGLEAPSGRWPWMAAIYLFNGKKSEFWCGGSLIGPKYILTAAHCTRDSRQKPYAARQFTVRLGDVNLGIDTEPSSPVSYAVKEVRSHAEFNRAGYYNDIAILVLDRLVRKSKYIIPLCLPIGKYMLPKARLVGRRATVVGWGSTYYGGVESVKEQQADMPIWTNEECDQAYFQPILDMFICAGFRAGGVDACQGDSGGPLMIKYESRWVQVGIVSFGNKCGEPGYPGVYTRVTEFLGWIRNHTRN